MKSKIFTENSILSFAEVPTNMTNNLFFYGRWGRVTPFTCIFLGLFPNNIWATYDDPHNLYLESFLVSLFSFAPPPIKWHYAGRDRRFIEN